MRSAPMRTAGARWSCTAPRDREHVVRLDRDERVHAPVVRHTGAVGGLGGAQHERGGLVDVPLRAVQLGVRRREHRVLRRRVLEELGWHRVAPPRVGIRRGHALNADHSSAVARAFSATDSPSADRSAVSTAEYISGALMNPAARSGAGMISSAGRIDSSGATSSLCTVSTGAVPVMRPRRSRYFASPPTTMATSRSPLAMARHARVNGVSCSTPSSAITERAFAPTRSATIRPGSR